MSSRDLERLGAHVAERVGAGADAVPDLALRAALSQRVARRDTQRPRRRALSVALGFGVAALAVLVLVLLRQPAASERLTFEVGGRPGAVGEWIVPGGRAGVSLRFSEGSRMALDPGSRAEVTRLERRGAEVVLAAGLLHADVIPRPGNAWRVRTGPFLVEVKGTRFDVSWDEQADAFELALFEGHVVVSGCSFGKAQSVTAGERVRGSCRAPGSASTAKRAPAVPEPGAAVAEPAPSPGAPLAKVPGSPSGTAAAV